jgi:hypothetical protein
VDNALREIVALLNYSRETSGCVIDVLKDRKLSKGELGSNYGKLFSCCCELLLRHLRDFDNADNVSKNEKIPPYYTKVPYPAVIVFPQKLANGIIKSRK